MSLYSDEPVNMMDAVATRKTDIVELLEQIELGIAWIEVTPGKDNRIPLDRDHGLYLLRGALGEIERLRSERDAIAKDWVELGSRVTEIRTSMLDDMREWIRRKSVDHYCSFTEQELDAYEKERLR